MQNKLNELVKRIQNIEQRVTRLENFEPDMKQGYTKKDGSVWSKGFEQRVMFKKKAWSIEEAKAFLEDFLEGNGEYLNHYPAKYHRTMQSLYSLIYSIRTGKKPLPKELKHLEDKIKALPVQSRSSRINKLHEGLAKKYGRDKWNKEDDNE